MKWSLYRCKYICFFATYHLLKYFIQIRKFGFLCNADEILNISNETAVQLWRSRFEGNTTSHRWGLGSAHQREFPRFPKTFPTFTNWLSTGSKCLKEYRFEPIPTTIHWSSYKQSTLPKTFLIENWIRWLASTQYKKLLPRRPLHVGVCNLITNTFFLLVAVGFVKSQN